MDWRLKLKTTGPKPKYRQMMDFVSSAVASGRLKPGDRIPSVAELANRLSVNKATVVRAFRELERQKLIVSQVGRGSFVAARALKNGETVQRDGDADDQAVLTRPEVVGLVRRLRDTHVAGVVQLLGVDPPKPFINLWAGVPPETTIPPGLLERAAVRAIRHHREALYRYHHNGLPQLRERLAKWLSTRGYDLAPDQILITNGSQQAIGLIATWALNEQRTAVVETPTYIGTPRLFMQTGTMLETIPWDGPQLRPDRLVRAVRARPSVVYCCPEFHNPTGQCLSADGRAALVETATRWDAVVVVDDIFRDLRFAGKETPSLYAQLPPARRMLVGSFSKTFMPGLRIGFLAADRPLIEDLALIRRWMDLGGSPMTQAIMADLLENTYPGHLETMRAHYRQRRDAARDALRSSMPDGVTFTVPDGGFSLWVQLPSGSSAIQVYLRALEQGVTIYPGPAHDIDGRYLNCFRLCYGWPSPDEIRRGVEILGRIVRETLKRGPVDATATGAGVPL